MRARDLVCAEGLTRRVDPEATLACVKDAADPVPALKEQLAHAILERFHAATGLTIARRLGIGWPRASNLQRGQLQRFSLQQLVRFAARADGKVSISVTWTSRR